VLSARPACTPGTLGLQRAENHPDLFGLRSAPKIFSAVADALQWALEGRGVKVIHYQVLIHNTGILDGRAHVGLCSSTGVAFIIEAHPKSFPHALEEVVMKLLSGWLKRQHCHSSNNRWVLTLLDTSGMMPKGGVGLLLSRTQVG